MQLQSQLQLAVGNGGSGGCCMCWQLSHLAPRDELREVAGSPWLASSMLATSCVVESVVSWDARGTVALAAASSRRRCVFCRL